MKTVKVADATNEQLNWLVAKCEGHATYQRHDFLVRRAKHTGFEANLPWHLSQQTNDPMIGDISTGATRLLPEYTTDWSQIGPIIDSERISVIRCDDEYGTDRKGFTTSKRIPLWGAVVGQQSKGEIFGSQGDHWGTAYSIDDDTIVFGQTPLIAAARCYVASKLGDTVQVPEELN